ncbi:MAG: cell division protein FtsL [Albidovulum sp.]|nr:cell division protein FtsL [Albidovulum sp.]
MLAYIVSGMLVFVLAVWAYSENYATRDVYGRIEILETRIADKREELAHLRAEWSYLNRPERLNELVSKFREHLELTELTAERFGGLVELPERSFPTSTPGTADRQGTAASSR